MFLPQAVAFLLLGIALLYVFGPSVVLLRRRQRLADVCRARRAIGLTFDDGPGRFLTPRVLQRLAAAGVPATFFLLGRNVRDNQSLVQEIRRRGHELGTHGDEHVHHLRTLPWTGIVDTLLAWRRVAELGGRDGRRLPFRPPFGKLNLLSLLYVAWERTPIAMWTHDSFDTRPDIPLTPERLAARLRDDGGGVLLLHDFDRATRDTEDEVLAKLDAVLALRAEGFAFVRVGELIEEAEAEFTSPTLVPAEAPILRLPMSR